MKKKLISSVLAVILTFGTVSTGMFVSTGAAHAASFSDISDHWAKSYILKAADAGIITGYPDGTFLPDKPVKRSEFTRMINNTLGNSAEASISFTDVPSFEWYYNDVAKALAAGYVGGYDTGDFKPDNYISRQEAAVMLSRIVPTADYSSNLSAYKDYANVSDWAQSSLSRIVGKKYIGAYDDGLLHPLDNLTRAQAAKILYDVYSKENIVKSALTVKDEDTTLTNKIYSNGITLHKDIGDGKIKIDNCVVLGSMYVQGGGSDDDYVTIVDSRVSDMQISKSASPVKVLAKDDTRILKTSVWKDAVIETSSLDGGLFGTGFDQIDVYGSTTTTLDGNFPSISLKGASADLDFTAGTITKLTVDSAAKNSEVVSGEYATVNTADVNAATEFKGEGKITTLNANASGITYETKPKTINTAKGVSTPTYADAAVSISVSPKNADTGISVDTDIVLSFSTAIKKYNGNTIDDDDLDSMIELRKDKSSGTKINFSATINSSKKKITISPDTNLDYETKYYVIMKANTVKDSDGEGNSALSSYFTTEKADVGTITISPKNKATNVTISDNITITFGSAMKEYDGGTISDADVKDIVELHKGSAGGTKISFTGSINSAKKVMTINPDSNLDYETKYYVVIPKNKVKDSAGSANSAFQSYFTTAPNSFVISNITASSNEDSMTISVTPSQNGTLYAVLLENGAAAPNADQIRAGKDGSGAGARHNFGSVSVTKDTAKTLPTVTGLDDSTTYKIYCVLVDGSKVSPVKTISKATTAPSIPDAELTSLAVSDVANLGFSKTKTSYDAEVPFGTTTVTLAATATPSATIMYSRDNATWDSDLADTSVDSSVINKFYVKVMESGKHDTVYTVNVEVTGNTGLASITVNSNTGVDDGSVKSFQLDPTSEAVAVVITADDSNAVITCNSLTTTTGTGSLTGNLTLSTTSNKTEVTYTIKSNLDTKEYTFKVLTPEPTPAEPTSPSGIAL